MNFLISFNKFIILFSLSISTVFASAASQSNCEKMLQELGKLKTQTYSTGNRAEHLVLKKSFDLKIKEIAQKLGVDPKVLETMDFSQLSKEKLNTIKRELPTYIQDRIKNYLKNDPQLNQVVNFVHLALSYAENYSLMSLMEYAEKENNLIALKAALLVMESWDFYFSFCPSLETRKVLIKYFFLNHVIVHNDYFLTKLWIINGGDTEDSIEVPLINKAIIANAFNVANALIDHNPDLVLIKNSNYPAFPKVLMSSDDFERFHFLYFSKTYKNLEFLKKLHMYDAEFFSLRQNNLSPMEYFGGFTDVFDHLEEPLIFLDFISKVYRRGLDYGRLKFGELLKLSSEPLVYLHTILPESKKYEVLKLILIYSISRNAVIEDDPEGFLYAYEQMMKILVEDNNYLNKTFLWMLKHKKSKIAHMLFEKGGRVFGGHRNYLGTKYSQYRVRSLEKK